MDSFKALTFNCNGLGNRKKRQKVFNYLKDKLNHGFCFLQETHSVVPLEFEWKKDWNNNIFFSHGTSNSTGCAIAFSDNFSYKILKESKDDNGRFLILETEINDEIFLLVNFYNANSETDQLSLLDSLASKLQDHNSTGNCKPIFGGDFNLFFDTALDCSGGNPSLKKHSIAKLTKILDNLDVSDIFRVRYPLLKRYTFNRKNPRIQRRLDYMFTCNNIQEYIDSVDILPSFASDHSPVAIKINLNSNIKRGNYSWKFNNSLLTDSAFKTEIKNHFSTVKQDIRNYENPHLKWEYFKYQARKFSIAFSKRKKSEDALLVLHHENIISSFESSDNPPSDVEYLESKTFIDSYIEKRTQGAILRCKSVSYEHNEKSSKYFLNLEKKRGENGTVKKLVKGDTDISNSDEILKELHSFYSNLFDRKISKTETECKNFLDTLNIPTISEQHKLECEKALSLEDLETSLFKMSIGKSPGNDGLSVEFYKTFWDDIKNVFFESVCYSRLVGELSISQRQAIIKLIEKKDKDKRFIANWRPISLLNVDTKIISKSLASRFIPILPTIISADQTAYVKGRYIGESIRLISDILECSDKHNVAGYLLTVDLEKAFDSVDHTFLISCMKKFGFGTSFLSWISILLKNNESCVSNGGRTTKYFSLNRGARQGDPIAAYFFIIVLEIFFIMVRSNNNIKKLKILGFEFLLSAYADDTTFFMADISSVAIILSTFNDFACFSGMKINQGKCELAGIGVKKNEITALCDLKNVSLLHDTVRVLGVHFSYNQNLYIDRNFLCCINKLRDVIRAWGMRILSLAGKVVVFKTMALSKVIYIGCMSNIPNSIIKLLEKIHKDFIWDKKRPNIKHLTMIADYSKGGLKDIDITFKFKALHLSWVNRLLDDNFHPWKKIPLYYFNSISSNTCLFHPNLHISEKRFKDIPVFYKKIILYWMEISQSPPTTPSMVYSESLWFNSCIKINGSPISPSFCNANVPVYLADLFTDDGVFITWDIAVNKLNLSHQFQWLQIISSIPPQWKNIIRGTNARLNESCLDSHLNSNNKIIPVSLINSKYLYSLFSNKIDNIPTSQKYFERVFGQNLEWEKIYLLPRIVIKDSYIRIFQFKILHNVLFLNSRLFKLNYSDSPLCSLCSNYNETPIHLFSECEVTSSLWREVVTAIGGLNLGPLSPQSAVLGFSNKDDNQFISNFILLIFKYCVYKNRNTTLNKYIILSKIKSYVRTEKFISKNQEEFDKKWEKLIHML